MNQVQLVGRATKDIELKTSQGGTYNCRFNIAVDRPRRKDGTRNADFPSLLAWAETAELCAKYVHKGDRIGVVGHIQTGSYDKDGHKIYTTDVVIDRIEFLSPRNQQESTEPTMTGNVTEDGFAEVNDSELPF